MKIYNKNIGNFGEELAVDYLVKNHYIIVHRNFKCKIGEIDIIATDEQYTVFIEVKTRYSSKYGHPCEAVSPYKQYKIIKSAQYYIMINKLHNLNFRFDVLEILLNYTNNNHTIRLIKNAFIL